MYNLIDKRIVHFLCNFIQHNIELFVGFRILIYIMIFISVNTPFDIFLQRYLSSMFNIDTIYQSSNFALSSQIIVYYFFEYHSNSRRIIFALPDFQEFLFSSNKIKRYLS